MSLLWCFVLFVVRLHSIWAFKSEFEALHYLFDDEWQQYNVPFSGNGTATVRHMLMINRIISLNLEKQVLSIDARIHIQYNDDRLSWDPSASGDLTTVRVPSDKIWKPDIILYNNTGDTRKYHQIDVYIYQCGANGNPAADYGYYHGAGRTDGSTLNVLAILTFDGTIIYIQPVQLHTYCKTPRRVPIGSKVTCSLKFGSWAFDGFALDIQTLYEEKKVDLSSYDAAFNREWEVTAAEVNRNVEYFTCCPEPYIDLDYTIELTRRN